MKTPIYDKAIQLKKEGYHYGKIRQYLKHSGYDDKEISNVLRDMDNEETHLLIQKQQIKKNRNEFIVSLILTLVALTISAYQYGTEKKLGAVLVLATLSTIGFATFKYFQIKRTSFTPSELLKQQRKGRRM